MKKLALRTPIQTESKWTFLSNNQSQRFIVDNLLTDTKGQIIKVILASIGGNRKYIIDSLSIQNDNRWISGWQ